MQIKQVLDGSVASFLAGSKANPTTLRGLTGILLSGSSEPPRQQSAHGWQSLCGSELHGVGRRL